jgi:hypothetical protein
MKSLLSISIYLAAIAATSAVHKGEDAIGKVRFPISKTLVERKMHKHKGKHADTNSVVGARKHDENHTVEVTYDELVQKKHHRIHNETKVEVSGSTRKKHHSNHTDETMADEIGLTNEPELIEKKHHKSHTDEDGLADESALIGPEPKHHKNHTRPIDDIGLAGLVEPTTKHNKNHRNHTDEIMADEIGLTNEPELIEKKHHKSRTDEDGLAEESALIGPEPKHHKNHTQPIDDDIALIEKTIENTGLAVKKEMGRNGHGPKDTIAAMIEAEEEAISTIEASAVKLEDTSPTVTKQQHLHVSSATKSTIWIFYVAGAGVLSTLC